MESHSPTREEVRSYCAEQNLRVNPDRFYDYYARFDFKYKGLPIDWKARLSKWEQTEYTRPNQTANAAVEKHKPMTIEELKRAIERI